MNEMINRETQLLMLSKVPQMIDERIRNHIAEKDRQIQNIEKDIVALKQKECYCTNDSRR